MSVVARLREAVRPHPRMRGHASPDGRSVLVQIAAGRGGHADVGLAAEDLQPLTAMLLLLSHNAAVLSGLPHAGDPARVVPIPLRSISLGEHGDGERLLMLEVGGTMLGFEMTREAAIAIGQELLRSADR